MKRFLTAAVPALLVQFAASSAPPPGGTLLFRAGGNHDSQPLALANRKGIRVEEISGEPSASIEIQPDPYKETAWEFRFAGGPLAGMDRFVLEIAFLDRGAGVIEAQLLRPPGFDGSWSGSSRKASYTRLDTDTDRTAFFEFSNPGLDWNGIEGPHLRVTGLQHLRSISLRPPMAEAEWENVRASVPVNVEPMVKLERPVQRVCSAGVAVLGGPDTLQSSLDALHELAPLAKVLGFTSIESYVRWDRVEVREGEFDFGYYDAVVEKIGQYGLKWFPLLIVGSAYTLPDWFIGSEDDIRFACLEHGETNPIQSIWSPRHRRHVTRFLQAFGRHYEPMGVLEGVRLGPTGNYGESQYPAGGNWGHKGNPMHIHIGFWAGDLFAEWDFRTAMREKYGSIQALNEAWNSSLRDFTEVRPMLPMLCESMRRRIDFAEWYTGSMSDWCEWWALEARKAMPETVIFQSAGGWGFLEAGTDYADQAASMTKIGGGIRLTNETDSFLQNFGVTRLGATAARLYGIDLGYEPASSHTARGVAARIFNTASTNGDHFFTYHPNLFNQQLAIQQWLEYATYLDEDAEPVVDVAVYYPETMNQLDGGAFRYLYGWGFYPRAREIRNHIEVDYLNERLIREGFLDRYKALVMVWGSVIEDDVQAAVDEWMREGGTVFYPSFPRGNQITVEEDAARFRRWSAGGTGEGRFIRFPGDMEPPSLYGEFVAEQLLELETPDPRTRAALRIRHPENVYFSVRGDGGVLALNYNPEPAEIGLPDGRTEILEGYSVARFRLETP